MGKREVITRFVIGAAIWVAVPAVIGQAVGGLAGDAIEGTAVLLLMLVVGGTAILPGRRSAQNTTTATASAARAPGSPANTPRMGTSGTVRVARPMARPNAACLRCSTSVSVNTRYASSSIHSSPMGDTGASTAWSMMRGSVRPRNARIRNP